jgi:hypothetical protein
MTELVDGSPATRGSLEEASGKLADRAQEHPEPGPEPLGRKTRWRDAAIVFGLTMLVPGCGHAYARRWVAAILWSLLFVAVAFPAAMFAFAVWSSFSPAALPWISVMMLLVVLACAAGPTASALKGQLFADRRRVVAPAGIGLLASYAAAFTVLLGIEIVWFLVACLETRTTETSRLEPLLPAGRKVTVLLSRYLRPVHGDVVLCRMPAAGGGGGAAPEVLARVLARPGDTIQSRAGKLLVDGVEVDLRRNDQKKALEKAGRAERRRHLLPGSKPPSGGLANGSVLDWGGSDWGPHSIPEPCWLVVLDVGDMEVGSDGSSGPPAKGALVGKDHLLGRAILRSTAR